MSAVASAFSSPDRATTVSWAAIRGKGFVAARMRGPYVTTKYAIEGYTDVLRLELSGTGIHAILLAPGPIVGVWAMRQLEAGRDRTPPEGGVHA